MLLKKSDYSVQIKVMHGWKQFSYAVTCYFQSAQKSTSPLQGLKIEMVGDMTTQSPLSCESHNSALLVDPKQI